MKRYSKKYISDLVLKIKKEDLFDSMVLAPHNEINDKIFQAVENYQQQLKGFETFKLILFTDITSKPLKEKFKELFKEHYEDENKRANKKLRHAAYKTIFLVILSIAILFTWYKLQDIIIRDLFGTLWAFNLWEASHYFLETMTHLHKKRALSNIKNIEINFVEI